MSKIAVVKPVLDFKLTLELSEVEIRALDAVFGYSPEAFLQGCYRNLGRHYIEPHAAGVRSLHETVRGFTGSAVAQMNAVREAVRNLP